MLDSGRLTFQHQKVVRIANYISDESHALTLTDLIPCCVFFAIRHAIKATWLNDRDQFLYPRPRESNPCHSERSEESKNTESKKKNKRNSSFALQTQNDKVGFSDLTNPQNDDTTINHFIPFSEKEVGAKEAFASHFMHDFLNGKIKQDASASETKQSKNKLFSDKDLGLESKNFIPNKPLVFSKEAQDVFEAGLKIWQYYHQNFEKIPEIHAQHNDDFYRIYNANASLYDIKGYFQGFTQSGNKSKMNAKSQDPHYNDLIAELKIALEILAKKIEPRIYEYGFLLE